MRAKHAVYQCVRLSIVAIALILTGVPISAAPLAQRSILTPTDLLAGNGTFGSAVALSRDAFTALIGAPDFGGDNGAAYFYSRSGMTWTQQLEVNGNRVTHPNLGFAVALSADETTAFVTSLSYEDPPHAGECFVFIRNGSSWTLQADLMAANALTSDGFGRAVATSSDGNIVIVSGGQQPAGGGTTGGAYIFVRNGATWTQQQALFPADPTSDNQFGNAVAISADGNTALIGAEGMNIATGAAYIFTRNGSVWTQQQELTAADATTEASFGSAVALNDSGTTAIIGANNFDDLPASAPGKAYEFVRVGTSWSQQQELTASDGARYDAFGSAVVMTADGTRLLVGAREKTLNGKPSVGAAYVFGNIGGVWSEQQELTASDGTTNYRFGTALTVDQTGRTTLVGAPYRNNAVGAVYTFTGPAPTVAQVLPGDDLTRGGQRVTIIGTDFGGGASVLFGGVAATNVTVVNSTTITATVPPHAAGAVDVVVANPDTQYGILSGGFIYQPIPPPTPRVTGDPPNPIPPAPAPANRIVPPAGETPNPLPIGR